MTAFGRHGLRLAISPSFEELSGPAELVLITMSASGPLYPWGTGVSFSCGGLFSQSYYNPWLPGRTGIFTFTIVRCIHGEPASLLL